VVQRLPSRLRPPASLSPGAREVFLDIVADEDPAHFEASDLPLLCTFCEAAAMSEHGARQIWAAENPQTRWLGHWEKAAKVMNALALRLRLSPQARMPNNPKRAPSLSYYQRRELEEEPDDAG